MAAELNSNVKIGKAFGGGIAIATSEEWEATTKVFPAGLWLQESDTGLLKITDGVNVYSDLDYRIDPYYTGLPVFYHFYHDTFINNPSFVHADNFSWHSGAIFVAAFNMLVEEYNNEASVDATDTIDGLTVNYKLTPNGFKIVDAAHASQVSDLFDATGVAWYYILDQTNQFFKLPRNSQLTMGRDALTTPGTYTELSAASGSGFSAGTVRQYLYFFMGNSIQNGGSVDFAGVNATLTNLATRIEALEGDGGSVDFMPISGGTFTGGVFEKVVAMTNNAIDASTGSYFTKTITANTTFTISGVPSGSAGTISLILTNGGNFTVTWPSSFKWAEGTPPTLTTDGTDLLTFATTDGGTTWFCAHSLTNVS